jgi:hypothetical protein
VRFAALNERAKIRDGYRPCDVTINMFTQLACLPFEQPPSSIGSVSRQWWTNL